jgi:hypothetical protein
MTIGLTGEPGRGLVSSTTNQAPAAPTVTAAQSTAPGAVQTTQAQAAAPVVADQARTQSATVDPSTMTVQGQLAGLISSGNPLLVQAQTRAAQQANRRGLLNSSIAVGAGESALYDAALPIAQADAGTYRDVELSNADMRQQTEIANVGARNQTQQFNVGEQNLTSRFNTGEQNTGARFSAEQQQQTALENTRLQQQANMTNAENQTRALLQQMDANTRVEMTNIEANYRTLMQASQSASDLYSQTLRNITDITNNQNLDAAAKNAAIARQREMLTNGMNLIAGMNNLNVSELLNFGPAGGSAGAGGGQGTDLPTTPPPSRAPVWGDPDFSGGV